MVFSTENVHAALGEADDSVYVAYTDSRRGGVGRLKALLVRPAGGRRHVHQASPGCCARQHQLVGLPGGSTPL